MIQQYLIFYAGKIQMIKAETDVGAMETASVFLSSVGLKFERIDWLQAENKLLKSLMLDKNTAHIAVAPPESEKINDEFTSRNYNLMRILELDPLLADMRLEVRLFERLPKMIYSSEVPAYRAPAKREYDYVSLYSIDYPEKGEAFVLYGDDAFGEILRLLADKVRVQSEEGTGPLTKLYWYIVNHVGLARKVAYTEAIWWQLLIELVNFQQNYPGAYFELNSSRGEVRVFAPRWIERVRPNEATALDIRFGSKSLTELQNYSERIKATCEAEALLNRQRFEPELSKLRAIMTTVNIRLKDLQQQQHFSCTLPELECFDTCMKLRLGNMLGQLWSFEDYYHEGSIKHCTEVAKRYLGLIEAIAEMDKKDTEDALLCP